MIGLARRLRRDRAGSSVVQFAMVAPVMLGLIMGLSELAYQAYMQAILTGAVQKAGRDSGIQGAGTKSAQIDAVVVGQLGQLASGWTQDCSGSPPAGARTYCSARKSYASFANAAPEPFDDNDNNGIYNAATDCFTDVNGNGTWDADPGASGQGGANDVALYTMKATYPRLFPLYRLIGMANMVTLNASTALKNQPWATQVSFTPKRICPK